MTFASTPTRKTDEATLDQWNQSLRISPLWQEFMRSKGYVDPDGAVRRNLKLSDNDRRQLEAVLKSQGVTLPSGMKIDESGNFNQKNTLVRNLALGAGITAATLATMGAAGVFSGAGAAGLGAGSGGAIGAGGTLGATGIPIGTGVTAGLNAATGAGGGMGFLSTLGKVGKSLLGVGGSGGGTSDGILNRILGAAGAGIGAASSGAASNRGSAIEAELAAERMRQGREGLRLTSDQQALQALIESGRQGLDAQIATGNQSINAGQLNRQQLADFYDQLLKREQEGRVGRQSAMRDLQVAEYINSGGASQAAPVTTSGRTLSTLGLGGRASTEAEKAGAAGMRDEVLKRLQGGNPLPEMEKPSPLILNPVTSNPITLPGGGGPRLWESPYTIDPSLQKSGTLERVGGILAPIFTTLGQVRRKPEDVNRTMTA